MKMVFIPTVRIDPAMNDALRATAKRQNITVSEATRDALSLYLSHPLTKAVPADPATPKRRAQARP